jgi:hypothetical protein
MSDMKKHLPVILGILGILSFIVISCKETNFCMDCDSEGIVKTTVSYGDSASITILSGNYSPQLTTIAIHLFYTMAPM